MKSLYFAAGLALILHGLFFSLNADWLQDEFVTNYEKKTLSMTMTYRSPQKPLPQPGNPPVSKKPPQPERKKKVLKPEIPAKPVSTSPTPLPSRYETMAEETPDSPPYEVPDMEFTDESDTAIIDQSPEGSESDSQDISEKIEQAGINTEHGIIYPRPYEDNDRPEYPRLAKRRGYEGVVILEILVSQEGEVLEVRVLKTSGYSILDEEAKKAVEKYRFKAGKKDGVDTDMWVNIPIRFHLK
jgi:protein TonB